MGGPLKSTIVTVLPDRACQHSRKKRCILHKMVYLINFTLAWITNINLQQQQQLEYRISLKVTWWIVILKFSIEYMERIAKPSL